MKMSDNFADKYFKADICSSAGLREQPIVRLLSEFKNGINYELRSWTGQFFKQREGKLEIRVFEGRDVWRTLIKDEHSYHLMQEGFTDFCDDNFLIDSSEQDTETDCLLHCESTGDPTSLRPRGPFNYVLYNPTAKICFCQSFCVFKHIPNCDAHDDGDLTKGEWNLWRYESWWHVVEKEWGHEWPLSGAREQRINLKTFKSMEDDLKRILESRTEMEERGKHQKDEL